MKVVYVLHQFLPRHVTGTETYTYGLAKAIQGKGHEVAVLCYEHSLFEGVPLMGMITDEVDGIPVHRLCFHPHLAPNHTYYEYYNPIIGEWARRFFEEQKPDVAHFTHVAHLTSAVIEAAWEARSALALTLTDFWFLCPRIQLMREDGEVCPGPDTATDCLACFWPDFPAFYRGFADLLSPLCEAPFSGAFLKKAVLAYNRNPLYAALVAALHRKPFLQEMLERVGAVIAPSRFLFDMHQAHCMGAGKLKHLPFGLDVSRIQGVRKKPSSSLRVAFIGTLAPHKGCYILIEAFRQLRSRRIQLAIYGSTEQFPDYAAKLKERAARDERIRFMGTFPPDEIGNVFSDIDVLVVPSLWYENTPLIAYSAFAAETPIIASNMGGLREVVEPEVNGMLFEKGNVQGLRHCLERILEEPDLLNALKSGITPVKTMEEHAEEILAEYGKLVERRVERT